MTTREEIVESHAAAACWRALTLLAETVRGHRAPIGGCSLLIGDAPAVCLDSLTPPAGDGWRVSLVLDGESASNGPPAGAGESRYRLDDLIVLRRLTDGALPSDAAALLEIYLPYCMAPVHARRVRRSFTVSHFAQSLDGRIATDLGDSRWIGCAENLVHAHRMRALCDGILIGARTLRTDHPALTVRHAEGSDPIRIVVGGGVDVDIDCLARAGPGRILLIGEGKEPASPQVERLALPTENGRIATTAILARALPPRHPFRVHRGGRRHHLGLPRREQHRRLATPHLAAHHRPRDQFVPKAGDPVRGRIGALRQPCLPVGR